jgi:hypothetical protein
VDLSKLAILRSQWSDLYCRGGLVGPYWRPIGSWFPVDWTDRWSDCRRCALPLEQPETAIGDQKLDKITGLSRESLHHEAGSRVGFPGGTSGPD